MIARSGGEIPEDRSRLSSVAWGLQQHGRGQIVLRALARIEVHTANKMTHGLVRLDFGHDIG